MRNGIGHPVELPEEISEPLGLGKQATTVRPLSNGGRTLLLERVDGDGAAVPWDRELVLSADVRAFPLAGVLQTLHAAGKSGFLLFESGECTKSVYLHAGEIVFATSDQVIDRLGNCLVRHGVIGADEHRQAVAAYSPPGHYGRFLIERGLLTPRELWDGVKCQVEDIVRSLFALGSGRVHFWDGEARPDNVVRLALPTGRLIEEGLWHREELLVYLAQLEDSRVRVEKSGEVPALNGVAAEIQRCVQEPRGFEAIRQELGLDSLSAASSIQLLEEMGAVRILRGEGSVAMPPPELEDGLRDCVIRHVKLLDELFAPVVALDGPERVQSRLAGVLEEASARHSELLGDLELGRGGSLDPECLLERARLFPGDREAEVREALGELIAYAEFELVNHPRIESPDGFLSALEPLRAQL